MQRIRRWPLFDTERSSMRIKLITLALESRFGRIALSVNADIHVEGAVQGRCRRASDRYLRGTLHYRWNPPMAASTMSTPQSTNWTLPGRSGLHFAFVLFSNGLGGYTERRMGTTGRRRIPQGDEIEAPLGELIVAGAY